MKLFQQLLVAPAALGLLSPLAVSASELNLDGVNQYASEEQVTSIDQFSDVYPTDWAFQALSNLIERYGCVAGYPDGTYRGKQAMTRYEAAALLNACLDRVTEMTDELKRLIKEFEKELAVLRGRVDGLEAKVGELEATQFSTTTKLEGDAVFVIGANSFGGSQDFDFIRPGIPDDDSEAYPDNNRRNWGATVFNYDVRLNLKTSFTGKDLLYTRLRAGNFDDSPFSGNPYNLMALDRAYSSGDVIEIDRLYYRFPIGRSFTALLGAKARNTEFLAIEPWFYKPGLLDVYALNGAPGTYNKATGSAFGLMWKSKAKKGKPYFGISTSYVARDGAIGDPSDGGLMNGNSRGNWLTQLGFAGKQWALTGAWRYGTCDQDFRRGSQFANQDLLCGPGNGDSAYSNSFAVTAAWQPARAGWLPSINLGWGYNDLTQAYSTDDIRADGDDPYFFAENIEASQSWAVALQWDDVFWQRNQLGMAVGQPVFATKLDDGTPRDGNYVWEWWYKFQVTDNISVTPMLYYLSRPNGQYTAYGESSNVFGGLVQTQFKF